MLIALPILSIGSILNKVEMIKQLLIIKSKMPQDYLYGQNQHNQSVTLVNNKICLLETLNKAFEMYRQIFRNKISIIGFLRLSILIMLKKLPMKKYKFKIRIKNNSI